MSKWTVIGYFAPRWKVIFEELPESFHGKIILDCGMGDGLFGWLIRHLYSNDEVYLCGLDGYPPLIERQNKMGIYNDVRKLELHELHIIKEKYDYVFCLDVLEHNPKEYFLSVIDELKRLTRKKLFITTPCNEPVGQSKRSLAMFRCRMSRDNSYSGHVSSWGPQEFNRMGFRTLTWDKRKNLSKSVKVFDTIRRWVFGVDWNPKGVMAIWDSDVDEGSQEVLER